MDIEYDAEADALYLRFRAGEVACTREVQRGVFVDYNSRGDPLGVEIVQLSKAGNKTLRVPDGVFRSPGRT